MAGRTEGKREPVRARAQLTVECGSQARARVLWEAVSTDDPGAVLGRLDGTRLVIDAGPASAPSLRVTLDDVLACLQVASGAAEAHMTGDDGEVG